METGLFITRHAIVTFDNGAKIQMELRMVKSTKPMFPEVIEQKFIDSWNESQPNAEHKAVKCHLMRN